MIKYIFDINLYSSNFYRFLLQFNKRHDYCLHFSINIFSHCSELSIIISIHKYLLTSVFNLSNYKFFFFTFTCLYLYKKQTTTFRTHFALTLNKESLSLYINFAYVLNTFYKARLAAYIFLCRLSKRELLFSIKRRIRKHRKKIYSKGFISYLFFFFHELFYNSFCNI